MKFILILLFFSLLFLPTVVSDLVDITIEYETTTVGVTTTPAGVTTAPGGAGGDGGGVTTTTIEVITEEIMLTYSMPGYFEIYQNETGVFNIKVKNDGQLPLNNIFITISGIPGGSYSIDPSRINTLGSGDSSSFSVSIDPEGLTVGKHTLTVTITSDEKSETASLTLDVKSYTRKVAEEMERQEIEEQKEQTRIAWWTLLVTMILILVSLLSFWIIKSRTKKPSPIERPEEYPAYTFAILTSL